ncbi:hypothetical protein PG995_005302 [Apiospora arundinis]
MTNARKLRSTTSRRSHPKSRTGCKTCKLRKVKCDEKKPKCGNCIKHNADCDFAGPARISLPQDINCSDLELLHNFTTRTFSTLSGSPVLREFYRITAVHIGLKCDYVMRALLAVSSLHLAHHRPEMHDRYMSLAIGHHHIATTDVTQLMNGAVTVAASNLFLFSVLTIFFALGCPRKEDEFLLFGESGFPDWLFLLKGTRVFIDAVQTQPADDNGVLTILFNHGSDRWLMRENRPVHTTHVHQQLDNMAVLIVLRQPDQRLRDIYLRAIGELHKSFSLANCGSDETNDLTDAFVWIYAVIDDLVPLLRVPTQEAVAIFAFFSVFFKRLGTQWYIEGWADHLISKAYSLLDEEHRLWIQWPLEEMGWPQ